MKLRIEVDGQPYLLDLVQNESESRFVLRGAEEISGVASVSEVMPGVFSILLNGRSRTVTVARRGDQLEVVSGGLRRFIRVADARDRIRGERVSSLAGPAEIRALMPGKVVQVLVQPGAKVEAGQGVIVVEAIKMQNEMKAPKAGTVARIETEEGATVAAGQRLLIIE